MRFVALGGFESSQARPQQAPLVGAALETVLPSVAAPVALRYTALGGFGPSQARPQQTPLVGAALVALAGGGHQQALCGAAPHAISAPGLLEWLAGLRSGLKLGSGLSPHMRGYNLNEGSGEIR